MILLAAEQGLKVPQIALIVRESEATVLRWLKRYRAEGMEGLQDAPRPAGSLPMATTPTHVPFGRSLGTGSCTGPIAP
jgi:Winged helix-turn helix